MTDIFVRALNEEGKWTSVNAMDLDDESFRRFILRKLHAGGLIYGMTSEGDEPPLRVKSTEHKADEDHSYTPHAVMFRGGKGGRG